MEKKQALEFVGFRFELGKYVYDLCTTDKKSYKLTCELVRSGYKVDTITPEGKAETKGAGAYKDTPVWDKIKEVTEMVEAAQAQEEEVMQEPEDFVTGGFNEKIQDASFEEVGDQRRVKRKPGRRIKNQEAEMMEGGKIRAGSKKMKNGKLLPNADEFFTITTMRRLKDIDPNDPDTGFERDEAIHKRVGDTPTRLAVRLPCNQPDLNFGTYFGKYTSATTDCRGDGEIAITKDGNEIDCLGEDCPKFEKGECKKHGVLSVILEAAGRFGVVYKFRTTSENSIKNLIASIDALTVASEGYPANIPLWLTLTPKETTIPRGPMKGKRKTIYMANLEYRHGGYTELDEYVQKRALIRAGRDPVEGMEKALEANLALPESPEECRDIKDTFCPDQEE